MKKLFLTLNVILLFTLANSQKKWSFGVEAFPRLSSYSYQENQLSFSEQTDFFIPSLSQQFYTAYRISQNLSISMGIGYSYSGVKSFEQIVVGANSIDPAAGSTIIDSTGKSVSRMEFNQHSIQIPLLVTLNATERFFIRGGLSTNILLSNTTTTRTREADGTTFTSTMEDEQNEYKKMLITAKIGIGYNIMTNEKMRIYAQPTFERSLIGLYKNKENNAFPFALGLVIGTEIF